MVEVTYPRFPQRNSTAYIIYLNEVNEIQQIQTKSNTQCTVRDILDIHYSNLELSIGKDPTTHDG